MQQFYSKAMAFPMVTAPVITTTSPLPGGMQGRPYSFTMSATGGLLPYTWSILSGSLDSGLSFSPSGVFSGTPVNAETDTLVIQVQDARGMASHQTFSLTIASSVPLSITTSSLPSVNQYATSYSSALAATGGTPPYTWSLVSQSGFNPLTWQIQPGSANVTNLMAMILNVETNNLQIQVTDSATPTPNTASKTLGITVNQQVPALAQALGYTKQILFDQPQLSEISFVAYGSHGNTKWYSGWPYSGTIPPAALFSMNAQNVLQMSNQGAGVGPSATVPIMSSVQLSNGSNVPIADQLPLLGSAYFIAYSWAIITPNVNARPVGFQFPTQHNVANTQDIDPFDNMHRFLEKDTNEGAGSNGKQPPGWGGNVPYWSGPSGGSITAFNNSNATPFAGDVTLQHEYGMAYTATGTATWCVDNVNTGSISAVDTTTGVPMTAEQLAWTNAMTDYAMWGALNDGSTPYTLVAYYVTAWGPPTGAPSAPANLQLINQGGPNNGGNPTFFTVVPIPPYNTSPGTKSANASYNYQGLSWLPATPGAHSIASYNIYRNSTLYDNVATPITITGYIATPTLSNVQVTGTSGQFSCNAATLYNGQFVTITGTNTGSGSISYNASTATPLTLQIQSTNGSTSFTLGYYNSPAPVTTAGTTTGLTFKTDPILTVTAVSGGTTAISDGKILPGLMLTSNASGFVAGTQIHEYVDANTGGGGTGHYSVNWPQTVGSVGTPATFTGWSYNDTQSTNGTVFDCTQPSTIYAYTVAAVDSASNVGPVASPAAYMYYGVSMAQCSNFSFGGMISNYTDVVGASVNGPYDVSFLTSNGGGGFQPTWTGAGPDLNGSLCPVKHFECGAFNYLVFDIKVADNTYLTHALSYTPILGIAGVDGNHWQAVDIRNYCTLSVGNWVTCKIPVSALPYGVVHCTGSFAATAQYQGNLTITGFGAKTAFAIDGSGMITGPGIAAGSFVFNYPASEPPSGVGPWVYTIFGPNILATDTGSGSYVWQGTNCYKHAWAWQGFASGLPPNTGVFYLNNIGFSTT